MVQVATEFATLSVVTRSFHDIQLAFSMIWKGVLLFFSCMGLTISTLFAQLGPQITSSPVTEAIVGDEYVYDVEVLGLPGVTFSLIEAPQDMQINVDTGAISWTPELAGEFKVTLTAANLLGEDSQAFTIFVSDKLEEPVITTTPLTSAIVGQDYSYDVDATGNPAPAFSLSEAPEGMTIDGISGVILWTPQSTGTFDVVVVASNEVGDSSQDFLITVSEQPAPPAFLSQPVTQAVVGQDYSYDVEAAGNPVPMYALSEAPAGMQIDAGSGLITWSPQTSGQYEVMVIATNDVGEATQEFIVTVSEQLAAPVITSSAVLEGIVNQSYRYDVNASGNPAPTFSLPEAPVGMTINASSGLIRWTPTAAGDYGVTISATNAEGKDEQSFTVVVGAARVEPVITSSPIVGAVALGNYSYDVEASGNPVPTFWLSESPEGMSIDQTSGQISWMPPAAGSYSVTVEAVNDSGSDAQSFTINVSEQTVAPTIVSTPVSQTFVNQTYTYNVDADGNPPPVYSLVQAPGGMSINSESGLISWVAAQAGSYNITVEASNVEGSARQDFTLTVSINLAAPVITSSPITQALVGLKYQYDINALGNPAPSFELIESPAGMTLDAETGIVNWTPDAPGSYNVVVEARNSQGSFTQSFSVLVGLQGSVPLLEVQSLQMNGPTELVLFARVNPNGSTTTVTFEYGQGSVEASKVTALPQTIGGFSDIVVLAQVSGLEEGKTYVYRAVAENNVGRIISATYSFTTYQSSYQVAADQAFSGSIDSQSYRLRSIPGDINLDVGDTMTGNLHTDWGAFRDTGEAENYFVAYDGSEQFHFKAGRGFWMLANDNWKVPEQNVNTVTLDQYGVFKMSLQAGWNIIASPFNVSLPWSLVKAATPSVSQTAKLWSFNGSFRESSTLEPYQAYNYFNDGGDGVVMSMPFPGTWQSSGAGKVASNKIATARAVPSTSASDTPLLVFEASARDSLSATAEIRIDPFARLEKDVLDQFAPRDGFSTLSLRFVPPFDAPYGLLALDARPSVEEGATFELEVLAPVNETFTFSVSGLEDFSGYNVVLVDPVTGQMTDLHSQSVLSLRSTRERTRYRLLIGSDVFVDTLQTLIVPEKMLLQQNYPNPFAGSTTISYSLTEAGYVDLTVYDMLGREVQQLISGTQQAGFHQISWDGRSGGGNQLPDGVYLLRMKTEDGASQTVSLTKLR